MSSPNSIRVQTDHLRCGLALIQPIRDEEGVVLVAAGIEITESIKQQLIARGIADVLLDAKDAAKMFSSASKRDSASGPRSDPHSGPDSPLSEAAGFPALAHVEQIAQELNGLISKVPKIVENLGPPLKERAIQQGRRPYSPQHHERLSKQFATTKRLMETMIRHAIAGLSQDTRIVETVIRRTSSEMIEDSDQTIATSSELPDHPEISARSIRLAVLAVGMAIELGWDNSLVDEVGTCALVHDWGFYQLPEDVRKKRSSLSAHERQLYQLHPLYTFEMLGKVKDVAPSVKVAAAQVHERGDGSGYPQGLKEDQIHPYAKLLHVADAYVSLTEENWGRPPFVPYDAMAYLLSLVKQRKLDREMVRALLELVALFPVGSHVQLSDGTEARVLRRGVTGFATPVVQRVEADRTIRFDAPEELLIDLARSHLKVTQPLPHPNHHEQRMDPAQHSGILWD